MHLSVSTRIFLGFAAVLAVFGAVSAFSVLRLHAVGEEIRLVSDGYLPLAKVGAQLETFHKNRQRDTDRLLDEKDERTRAALIKLARLYFPRLVREKLTLAGTLAAEARALGGADEAKFIEGVEHRLADLGQSYDDYDAAAEGFFAAMEQEVPAGELEERGRELQRVERRIDRELKLLSLALDTRVRERVWEAQRLERVSSVAILGFALAAIAIGLLAALLSQRWLAPILTLTQAAQRIGLGDWRAEVPTGGAGEVGVLAGAFQAMARSLEAREAELAEKNAALLRAERLAAVGQLAAQIAHEVRNPLSSIGLNAELLAEELPAESAQGIEARRLCAAIGREVDRLSEITEGYLRLARPPRPSLVREELPRIIEELVSFVRPELATAGIRVELALQPGLTAAVDEAQLRQALLNLVRNARDAMAQGGTLRIGAARVEERVEITVADSGVGIPPAALARIFEPFYTTKERGTGLGLPVTQQIVQEHGGRLRCEARLGGGAIFTVELPSGA